MRTTKSNFKVKWNYRSHWILTFLLVFAIAAAVAQETKKNVLFIAVDDLKPLLSAYGDEYAVTPHFDRLAEMGVTFTNAHCQQAVCGPSRASLLTGLYPELTEVYDLKTLIRDRLPEVVTLPQYFKENGYTTVGMGKIFDPRSVDKGYDEVSWSKPYIMPDPVSETYGAPALATYQSPEHKKRIAELQEIGAAKGWEQGKVNAWVRTEYKPATEALDIEDEGYFDGALTDLAVEQMHKLAGKSPFFLAVGYKKPHLPFIAPQKYWDLYDRENLPLAGFQQRAQNTIELPYHKSGELRSYTGMDERLEKGNLEEDIQRELVHGYYACVSYIDAQVGKLLDALEENGLQQSTIIVLWGDHGWHLGDHGLWCKHTNFEQATRTPLMIVDPALKKGIQTDKPVALIDIFPTLTELSGLPTPNHVQGNSLKPLLEGRKRQVNDFVVSQYDRGKDVRGFAIRNNRYRYVAWYRTTTRYTDPVIVFRELYDYRKDPLETVNIVAMHVDLADELQSQLDGFLQSMQKDKQNLPFNKKKVSAGKSHDDARHPGSNRWLKNGDFEMGEKSWVFFGDCDIQVASEEPFSGNAALRFKGTRGGASQKLTGLKPHTDYRVSVALKTQNEEAIVVKLTDLEGEDIKARSVSPHYEIVTLRFDSGKRNEVKLVLQKYSKGNGPSWFDQVIVEEVSDGTKETRSDENAQFKGIRDILSERKEPNFYFGATINYSQLNTKAEELLLENFHYTVPENAAKQTRVHPSPGIWNWEEVDAIVEMARKNGLVVRLHGPISPQASQWAKGDDRKPDEMQKMLDEYLEAECRRFNGHPVVKWMDVVNETVTREGEWFSTKPGTQEWENPWTILGYDTDAHKTPLYIARAFEIANQYAPDISLVFNQHGGMERAMWEKVKQAIQYLKNKGLRVDGLGWQAHLKSNEDLAFSTEELQYLSDLVDWAHANELDFHVTEIDYRIVSTNRSQDELDRQAKAYANILKVLLSKTGNGLVTFNTWGLMDGVGRYPDTYRYIFDEEGNPKPAFFALRDVLTNDDTTNPLISDGAIHRFDFESDLKSEWTLFGQPKPELSTRYSTSGKSSVAFSNDKSGSKVVIDNLSPSSRYRVDWMVRGEGAGMRGAVKVREYGGKEVINRFKAEEAFHKESLEFVTGSENQTAELVLNRWITGATGVIYIDDVQVSKVE